MKYCVRCLQTDTRPNIKFNESRDERIKLLGEEQAKDIEKRIFLQSIDINWKSHSRISYFPSTDGRNNRFTFSGCSFAF